MVKPIPDNVKELLSQLPSGQQVVLRSYIATLRSEIVSFEEEKLNADNNADPHAHFHGDVKCTADHGHVDTEHVDHHHEHVHTEHCKHDHDHKDTHTHTTKDSHDHHEHKHTEHCDHGHDHKEKHHEHSHSEKHDEGHQHKDHVQSDEHDHKEHHHHEHGHAEKTEHHDDIPAWKKVALSADPTAAPFGGNWQTESNISATEEMKKSAAMEE